MSKEINVAEELSALEKKKGALKKIMKIARSIEQLRTSLESVVLLGKPAGKVPQQVIDKFQALSEKIKNLPTDKIKQNLQIHEQNVTQHLNAITEISRPENYQLLHEEDTSNGENIMDSPEVDQLINDYRKSAQTAVALRIILEERGIHINALPFPVSSDSIENQISEIRNQETQYREKIKNEVVKLKDEAQAFLANDSLPEKIRESVQNTFNMLQQDLEHIKSGKEITELPYFVEVVELHDEKPEKKNQPELQEPKKAEEPPITQTTPAPTRKLSFFYKLWRWCTTPPSVGWKDIE